MMRRGWWAFVLAALTVGGVLAVRTAVVAAPDDAMAVDADANAPGVQATSVQQVGVPFAVGFDITDASTPWIGYNLVVDHPGLTFIPTDDLNGDTTPESWHYTGLGGTSLNSTVSTPQADRLLGGSATSSAPSTATGEAVLATFQCAAAGSASLHLVAAGQAVTFTTALGTGGATLPTSLADAQITCGAGGAVPTAVGPSPTPGGPAPTPGGPVATPTPLPPGYEAVDLTGGCNPVTTTYPNATPIQTIAGAVGPAGNLEALWEFEGGVWLGYSPAYPQASDLTAKDFLDVVFICVMGPGQFVRPIV